MNLIFILFIIILFTILLKNKNKEIKKININNKKKVNLNDFHREKALHFIELQLNFNKAKVLDIGSINGSFTKIISKLNGEVTLSTPHQQKYEKLKNKNYNVIKLDVENEEQMSNLDYYNYILCYDVLEHLENPIKAIKNMASKTDILIIESSFSNFYSPDIINIKSEKSVNTSLNEIGSRFSRLTIYKLLNNHFNFIYSVKKLPKHSSYQNDWNNIDYKDNLTQNGRDFIIASKKHITNINIDFGLIKKHY